MPCFCLFIIYLNTPKKSRHLRKKCLLFTEYPTPTPTPHPFGRNLCGTNIHKLEFDSPIFRFCLSLFPSPHHSPLENKYRHIKSKCKTCSEKITWSNSLPNSLSSRFRANGVATLKLILDFHHHLDDVGKLRIIVATVFYRFRGNRGIQNSPSVVTVSDLTTAHQIVDTQQRLK